MDTSQIVLFGGLLAMAAVTVICLIWVFYLVGELKNRPSPKHYEVEIESPEVFTPEELVTISEEARQGLDVVVSKASSELESALASTIAGLTTKTEDMAKVTISQEFEKYQISLEALREETIKEFNGLQKQLDERRSDLIAQMEAKVQEDREARMDEFNTRLNDVVSSYLIETLDKGVDLGAQAGYVVRMLETHKDDIKQDVLS